MKFIRQGLRFSWFLKRATTSDKISSRIKLRLRSNSANTTSSYDLLLINVVLNTSFLNKTQLKIRKVDFLFVLLGRTQFNAFRSGPAGTMESELIHSSLCGDGRRSSLEPLSVALRFKCKLYRVSQTVNYILSIIKQLFFMICLKNIKNHVKNTL